MLMQNKADADQKPKRRCRSESKLEAKAKLMVTKAKS
jgi:hypothetical protein